MGIKIPCVVCKKNLVEREMNEFSPRENICDECKGRKETEKYSVESNDQTKIVRRPKLVGSHTQNVITPEQKIEMARTGLLFDPKSFRVACSGGILKPYFDKVANASTPELKRFRSVIRQDKTVLSNQVFADSRLRAYDILKAAINHELLKRCPRLYAFYSFFIPIRCALAWWTGHRKGHYHKEFGILFVYEFSKNFFYKDITYHFIVLRRFWLAEWKWILSTSGGLGLLYAVLKNHRFIN